MIFLVWDWDLLAREEYVDYFENEVPTYLFKVKALFKKNEKR